LVFCLCGVERYERLESQKEKPTSELVGVIYGAAAVQIRCR